MIIDLKPEVVDKLAIALKNSLITGSNPFNANDYVFLSRDKEIAIEVIGSPLEIFDGINRVVTENKLDSYYGLHFGFYFFINEKLNFISGIEIKTNTTSKELWNQGFDKYNYNIDGSGYCFF